MLSLAIDRLRRESSQLVRVSSSSKLYHGFSWHRENQVADLCSIIDIILHLRARRTFSEVVSTKVTGSFTGPFLDRLM